MRNPKYKIHLIAVFTFAVLSASLPYASAQAEVVQKGMQHAHHMNMHRSTQMVGAAGLHQSMSQLKLSADDTSDFDGYCGFSGASAC